MNNYQKPIVFGVKHKDEDIRAASRSGGVFTAVSDHVLDNNGVVYGCVMKDCYKAVHFRAENKSERDRMRGSKYIQSEMGDIFCKVKADVISGRLVMFSGTSCQVAALKSFLGKEYENIFFVDIVCHGVPSPKVWDKYLAWQEGRKQKKIVAVDFRDKGKYGWKAHIETLYLEDGSSVSSEVFKNLFFGHIILRPSCYKCPYKSIQHPGDVTIADYWGIEKAAPGFNDDKGVSLVLINNERGEKLFEKCEECIVCVRTKIEDSMQPSFKGPFPRPTNREKFWKDYNELGFGKIARKYGGYGFTANFKKQAIKLKNRVIRKLKKIMSLR